MMIIKVQNYEYHNYQGLFIMVPWVYRLRKELNPPPGMTMRLIIISHWQPGMCCYAPGPQINTAESAHVCTKQKEERYGHQEYPPPPPPTHTWIDEKMQKKFVQNGFTYYAKVKALSPPSLAKQLLCPTLGVGFINFFIVDFGSAFFNWS